MERGIKLQKLNFKAFLTQTLPMFSVIENNRARLEPWFWWTSKKITPTRTKFTIFVLLYLIDTKRKQLLNKINNNKLYDEQFIIMQHNEISGMCGLDNIDNTKHDAEVWVWTSVPGIGDNTINLLQEYCVTDKSLTSVYAKVAQNNTNSHNLFKRNGYIVEKFEPNVRTSPRNPKITDLTTYRKQLSR